MKSIKLCVVVTAIGFFLGGCASANKTPSTTPPLVNVHNDIALGKDLSRYDYASIDPTSHRLYVAHLGASEVAVVDLDKASVVARVESVSSVHGVLAPTGLGVWFATATGSNELVAFDSASNVELWRVRVGAFPDGIGFDAATGTVAVSNKTDGSLSMMTINDKEPRRVAPTARTVKVGTEVGNVVSDPTTQTFLAATANPSTLVRIHTNGSIQRTIPLTGCSGAHGVGVSEADRVAVIACENNDTVVVVDLVTFKQVATLPVGSGPDVIAVDPGLHHLYVAAENGNTTILGTSPGKAAILGSVNVGPNAHTVAVDPVSHLVYFALHNLNGKAVLRVMRPTRSAQRQ
jgi:DNA-binding beta-propeller fold protein YncE